MKRMYIKLAALCLIVALLFTGCSGMALGSLIHSFAQILMNGHYVPFSEMEYTRPDLAEFQEKLDACMAGAKTDTDVEELMEKVYDVYDVYHRFYTNYSLANIYYYKDLTDIYWNEEYTFCTENSAQVDAGMDQLLYALAGSDLKAKLETDDYFGAGFFDDYVGESIWDETFTQLMAQEAQLQNEYDELSAKALDMDYYSDEFFAGVGTQMAELFVELVALRQKIAAYAGYDNYLQFAYEFYYYRDYTPEQAMGYLEDVKEELVDLYMNIPSDVWDPMYTQCSESEIFSYVENCANAMGATVADAFELLKDGGYYDISYGENKYNASFEVFLSYYAVPFVFMSPQGNGRDPLTFAHEFGHFCNDYASGGRAAGIDVAEVFSQGMEYLSLFYSEDTQDLERMKMADSLSVFVEQAAYASFEHQVYLLDEKELTVENVQKLYEQTGAAYGFNKWGWDSRDYVRITHFFIAPVYIISYVVSNDAAMQIYQAEQAAKGEGLKLFESNLATQEATFLAFVQSAGLTNPFEKGRVAQLRETFEKVLG